MQRNTLREPTQKHDAKQSNLIGFECDMMEDEAAHVN